MRRILSLGSALLALACSAPAPNTGAVSEHSSLAVSEDAETLVVAVAVAEPDAQPAPDAKAGPQCSTKTLEVGTEPLGYRATGQECDGLKQGVWSFTYLDGRRHRRGSYLDDAETGPWVFWFHNGKKRSEGEFSSGQRVGQWIRNHSNGVRSLRGGYREGLRHGRWRRWHNTGQLFEDRIYRDGKREGLHRKWTVAGDLQYVRFCKNDNCRIECRVSGKKTCPDPTKTTSSKNSP